MKLYCQTPLGSDQRLSSHREDNPDLKRQEGQVTTECEVPYQCWSPFTLPGVTRTIFSGSITPTSILWMKTHSLSWRKNVSAVVNRVGSNPRPKMVTLLLHLLSLLTCPCTLHTQLLLLPLCFNTPSLCLPTKMLYRTRKLKNSVLINNWVSPEPKPHLMRSTVPSCV